MAGSAARKNETMKKKNKRKLANSQDTPKPLKTARKLNNTPKNEKEERCAVEEAETLENMEVKEEISMEKEGKRQWRNLNLVLAIQNKQMNTHKKVELIFEFFDSRADKGDNDTEEFNTLSISRLITYTSNWIQSLLISSEKKIRAGDMESEESQFLLDSRCWEILRVCLKESEGLNLSLSLSRDLLRVISCVARSVLCSSNFVDIKGITSTPVEFQLFNTVNDCIKLLFSSHGRLLNENLDLWAVAVSSLLELVIRVYTDNLQDSNVQNLVTEFSCLVLEPFSKFLRLHPCRKNGFRDFVDKLVEPLLNLLGLLQDQTRDEKPVLVQNLVQNLYKLVEEILSYGLFHSVHLEEYLSLHITDKYSSSTDHSLENAKTIIKSYHRHLFDKVEKLVSERKTQALSGIGELLRLFVVSVKKLKKDSQDAINLTSEKSLTSVTPASEIRKSFFDFFVLTMEPLLLDLKKHMQSDIQPGTSLLNVYYTLRSMNKILSSMVYERAYLRMEDNSGGACLNFFKISYGLLMSCYAKFNQLWLSTWSNDSFEQVERLNLMAKEFILIVGNFLEIEYEVIGDDLGSIWLMILTCLTLAHSSKDVSELASKTIDLGCRVVNLYSELRQVDRAVFALCKGLRHLSFYKGEGEMNYCELSSINSSLHYHRFAKSGCLLLYSQKFRLAVCNVIKSLPEGQALDFIQTLSVDVFDCLEWMKVGCSAMDELELADSYSCRFSAQAKLLGMVLSELYALVLDSLSVSSGYSYRMGESIQELILMLRPSMRHLTTLEQDGPDEFFSSVLGTTQSKNMESKNDLLENIPSLLLFFFRVYVSCRSLYRQALSLMPPDSSTKMSKVMADFYTAYSGENCMKMTKFKDKGYFSWVKSSASLLSILQFIKDTLFHEGSADYCCLIYVMHIMALQRLVDLSRQIHCVEYILRRSEYGRMGKLTDGDALSDQCKGKKKQEKLEFLLLALKQEAAGLTGFITENLSNVDEKQKPIFDSWDLGVCTVNEKTLPTAIWWIICQNVDIWCSYATKKNLKLFLSLLILNSLPCRRSEEFKEWSEDYAGEAMKVTKHQISQELLHDTSFYDLRFVCRHMGSMICHGLKKCISQLFNDSTNIGSELDLSDWTSVLSMLQNSALHVRDKALTSYCALSDPVNERCYKGLSFTSTNMHLAACRSLLNLLCMTVEIPSEVKSFSSSVIYLINFERLIIGSLREHGSLHEHHEFLGLLVSCRRSLKYRLMAFCVEKSEVYNCEKVPILSEVPSSILWLLESVKSVITWWNTLSSQHNYSKFNDMIVSLMDHTSYVFFNLSKHQFGSAIYSIASPKIAGKSDFDCEGNQTNKTDCSTTISYDIEACNSMTMIVEALEAETKSFLISLKEAFSSEDKEFDVLPPELNKLSSTVSCIQGSLRGLESALNDIITRGDDLKVKLMKCKPNIMVRVESFMGIFMELLGISSRIFLRKSHPVKIVCDGQGTLNLDDDNRVLGTDASVMMGHNYGSESKLANQKGNSGTEMMPLTTSGLQNVFDSSRRKKRLKSDNLHRVINGLTDFGSFDYNCLRLDLLGSFFNGENMDAAFFLRGLLMASSAIVRLSMLIDCSPLPSNLMQIFLGCSEVLLTKFSETLNCPSPASFVWLDGTVKYVEAMGSVFTSTSPIATKDVYAKLVELHLKAIGKCISLQGKRAKLASHVESNSKIYAEGRVSESSVSDPLYGLDNLKARLRISFKALIEKPSEPLLLSALQALERALAGLQEGFTVIYEVKNECSTGGRVSLMVAGAVDCLDLLLEIYKGSNFSLCSCLSKMCTYLYLGAGITTKMRQENARLAMTCSLTFS